jgi:hypothetical protein
MSKKIIIVQIILLIFLTSCKSVKDGLSGKKDGNSDEFLVKKKSALVLPPDYEKLPEPVDDEKKDEEDEISIKDIILSDSSKNTPQKRNNESIEDFVINQINKD